MIPGRSPTSWGVHRVPPTLFRSPSRPSFFSGISVAAVPLPILSPSPPRLRRTLAGLCAN
ncbi:unnamed protein product, partial [Symbiodinium sp. CCMP2456]